MPTRARIKVVGSTPLGSKSPIMFDPMPDEILETMHDKTGKAKAPDVSKEEKAAAKLLRNPEMNMQYWLWICMPIASKSIYQPTSV
ncbi:hypothetical protein CL634_05040, partial [bacterium]|nr:hypothetical protein [bacterium]